MRDDSEAVCMSAVLNDLYKSEQLDKANVSVHSAFICLLHLANEKGLQFEQQREADFKISLC